MKNFFDFPIKLKLLAILSLITLLSGIALLVASVFVYRNISDQVTRLASKTLEMYAIQMDRTLSDLKKYSYTTIFTDGFQSNLKVLNYSNDQYKQLIAHKQITDLLFLTTTYSDLIIRVDMYSNDGALLSSSDQQTAARFAAPTNVDAILDANGRVVWGISRTPRESITLSRLIRTINNNFTYQPLGIITFFIDTKELADTSSLDQNFYTNAFIITDKSDNILYNSSDEIQWSDPHTPDHYPSYKDHQATYFITQKYSDVTTWNYYLFIPRKEIMGTIPLIFRNCGLIFLLVFAVTLFLCIYMARRITRPLSKLVSQMDLVAHGNFQIDSSGLLNYTDRDEIRNICFHFIEMTAQIDRLITENYKITLLSKESQIKSLQAQMDPHFLFNALDSINWMAKLAGQPLIASSIRSLSILLQKTINNREKKTTLSKELSLLEHYLTIQKLRFQERLAFEQSVQPDLIEQPIPVLTLQPIVENSIKYALEQMQQPCRISLKAEIKGEFCQITISDNGPGIPTTTLAALKTLLSLSTVQRPEVDSAPLLNSSGCGIGLKNVAERIHLMYNVTSPLSIDNQLSGGVIVTIMLPLPSVSIQTNTNPWEDAICIK